ncbi:MULTISPECIES: histone deacetylase family protein [unclassified Archaeoglobus]|mgnify:CR=1 FL=1|jgi:acetoin utilization deacetylase AcuC-like enzyme|uniref:histone deacetylase family protein n=1 Tax=unclassified Archaeoglobus TaxID=2643606 RepID=UPI0025BD4C4E|nr:MULTISPECIES: histone deacetylase [unclassified Archaeoglobus]
MITGIVFHEEYLKHEQSPTHPERRERLAYTMDQLREEGIFDSENIRILEPFKASIEDVLEVHTREYVDFLMEESKRGGIIDWDTNIPVGVFDRALLAAGGAIRAAQAVLNGEVDNAFAMIRPPGHHAKPHIGAGFCYLNNMAIMVKWLLKNGFDRVIILDWDAHHGDGTQEIFYEDDRVLFISTHQMPLYPGTGYPEECGIGRGEGYTVNIPLPPGTGDEGYMIVVEEVIQPVVDEFQPEFIAVSAGQDNHFTDPITSLALTARGYAEMMRRAVEMAERHCKGRLVAVLEGGYSVEGALPYTNLGIIAAMAGMDISCIREPENYLAELAWRKRESSLVKLRTNIEDVKKIHSKYWKCF